MIVLPVRLFRNTETVNKFFMESKDYQLVFSNATHFCFDECNFIFDKLEEVKSILEIPNAIESITYVVKRALKKQYIKSFFRLYNN